MIGQIDGRAGIVDDGVRCRRRNLIAASAAPQGDMTVLRFGSIWSRASSERCQQEIA